MLIDIALDAFGSDKAPEPEIRGAILACRALPVRVHLVGREPELRDLLGNTRKYAIPFCEYLDRIGVTRRDGDLRVLAEAKAPVI